MLSICLGRDRHIINSLRSCAVGYNTRIKVFLDEKRALSEKYGSATFMGSDLLAFVPWKERQSQLDAAKNKQVIVCRCSNTTVCGSSETDHPVLI